MAKWIGVTILTLLFVFKVNAATPIVKNEFYIYDAHKKWLSSFLSNGTLTVDHVSERGYELYGPDGTEEWLDHLGVQYLRVSKSAYTKALNGLAKDYPSYEDFTEIMQRLAKKRPELATLFSLGTTPEGREIWVMKISDNVHLDEKEPEFKYISTMHGDEIVGRELLYMLIEDILDSYGKDKWITKLVNSTEIFIMPNMNPDGTASRRRGNSSWHDLNRSFPDFT
ncbi:MAG: M14 family zinc carboxypeptidase, partial [Bacteriovoracia bacterium]